MKKTILVAALLSCFAITGFSQTEDKALAKTEKIVTKEGAIYAFIKSEPYNEYEILGKVNMPGVVWNGKAGEMINIATTRCIKQFPNADAVIIKGKDLSEAIAIKFK